MCNKCLFIFWVLWWMIPLSVWSQVEINLQPVKKDPYARFIPFDEYTGPYAGKVTQIIEDTYGYLWFASDKSLARFDGNNVRYYVNDWTPHSIISSEINCLEQDVYQRLLIGTANGLCQYDYEKEHFISILMADSGQNNTDSLHIRTMLADGDSILWLETLDGCLWKLDLRTFSVIRKYLHYKTKQPYYHYHSIFRDSQKRLWVGGRGVGPYMLPSGSNKLNIQSVEWEQGKVGNQLNDAAYFFEDSHGNIWSGNHSGIFVFDTLRNMFVKFLHPSSWAYSEGKDENMWLGTGSGLMKFNLQNGERVLYSHNDEDPYSIPGNYIYAVFHDSFNNLWISGSKGISIKKPEISGVQMLFHIPEMAQTIASPAITDLKQGKHGWIWVATSNKGFDRYNPKLQRVFHYNTKNTPGLVSDRIRCVQPSSSGDLYVGLWSGVGFGKLSDKTGIFELYSYTKENTRSDWYNDLVFDKNGDLYVGFWGGPGLAVFGTKKRRFKRFLKDKFNQAFLSRLITCLYFDNQGLLWMGTTNTGIHCYDPAADTSIWYSNPADTNAIPSEEIFDIRADGAGTLWVGTTGLYRKPDDQNNFEKIQLSADYSDLKVYKLLMQEESDIWLLTNHGLLRYNKPFQRITDYSHVVTLAFDDVHAAALRLSKQQIMLGGKNGLAMITPAEIKLQHSFPHVLLSSLRVFEKTKYSNLQTRHSVTLNYDENFFSILIGSMDFFERGQFHYAYKLEGFSEEWTTIKGDERIARFTNVPPGTYNFTIRLTSNTGQEQYDAASLQLNILPPFWQTWWFILLVIILTLGLIAFFWINRVKSLKLSVSNLELNQKLLRLQMNPHFIFNSLFAVQSYIYSNQKHLAGNYLSNFAHLIRLILDNSRNEYISFEKELETVDLYLKLQQLRFENRFTYKINFDTILKDENFCVPPMLAQPFLENAIEHGLRHLEHPGQLTISYLLQDNFILFTVKDNGIGLNAARKIKNKDKPHHESLAISICRKRLEILNKKNSTHLTFQIKELFEQTDGARGTQVQFTIPVKICDN